MSTSAARLRRLEARIARLEAVVSVPSDAAAAMARIAATQPVSPEDQARHRRELLEAIYGTRTTSPARAGREPHAAMPNAA